VDLSGSRDPRAKELERRIVLSHTRRPFSAPVRFRRRKPASLQQLVRQVPFGDALLARRALASWGRAPLLERSLGWYSAILPAAREKARHARISPAHAGRNDRARRTRRGRPTSARCSSGSSRHPIAMAELCYRAHPNRETTERYRDVVFETASSWASFAFFDSKNGRYVLGRR